MIPGKSLNYERSPSIAQGKAQTSRDGFRLPYNFPEIQSKYGIFIIFYSFILITKADLLPHLVSKSAIGF